MSALSRYIEELRTARGLNKSELARRLGVAFTTVNAWERKGAVPNRQALSALITELKLTTAEQRKLLDLAVSMGQDEPPQQQPQGKPAPEMRRKLELLLTRAIDPERHTFADASAVFGALAEAATLIDDVGATEESARRWLDAAAALREQGAQVTAARIAVVVVAGRESIRSGPKKRASSTL